MVLAKTWMLDKMPNGVPYEENFKLVTEELPSPNDGELIVQAEWLSVDPYMLIPGRQVARVIESKNLEYPVGSRVLGDFGWRSHTLLPLKKADGTTADDVYNFAHLLPEIEGLPHSTALGVLGRPGNSAYFGFLEICKPQPGDVVVVNAAAGVVGSAVCQIAKLKGCKNVSFCQVGGEFSSKVIPLMASMGRVSLCGAISTYNDHTRHIGVSTMCSETRLR
ncbi:prostaglandin reductase 1-like [Hyalella azteca]|uniref:15-oxoprostaglandin 13-reductase n=1 Tax=Hyalella azteca TaxID=294128 RepID=A0A979FQ13_HYAAZ|nr:prostaglandin reductase 1-like [Hyalella azteca]